MNHCCNSATTLRLMPMDPSRQAARSRLELARRRSLRECLPPVRRARAPVALACPAAPPVVTWRRWNRDSTAGMVRHELRQGWIEVGLARGWL